jgi:hypothetical protein
MIGYESVVVNGQLVPIAPRQGYSPLAFGPAYTGPGMWPRQGVYNVPPVLPSPALQASMAPASYGQSGSYGLPTMQDENGSPWSFRKSPVIAGLISLTAGLGLLHFVHYK